MAAEGSLPRLLLLLPPGRGEEESWFAERVLQATQAWARAEAVDLLEVDAGAPDFAPEPLEAFLGSASLFASRRVLVLARAGRALARWPRLVTALEQAIQDPAGAGPMAVHTGPVAAPLRKRLQELARKAGKQTSVQVHSFRHLYTDPPPWKPDPDQSEAARFAAAEARERGLRLGPGAAGVLVTLAGGRPGDLVQALEHFDLLGLRDIDEEGVRRVVAHGAEGSAFAFAEALLLGDTASVLRDLQRLRVRGLRTWDGRRLAPAEAFSLILAAISRERRRLAAVLAGQARGLDFAAACQEAGVPAGGPPARRAARLLECCDLARLDRILAALREAERQVKQGGRDPLLVLEWLALHLRRSPPAGVRR